MTILATVQSTVTAAGQQFGCTMTAELLPVVTPDGCALGDASVFSYVRDDASSPHRPLTVVFNGGPGAASSMLHLSGLATRTARIPTDLTAAISGPYELCESDTSLLDVTDLLFLDPIGTGYGRLADDAPKDQVYGLEADAAYFADLVRDWLHANRRVGCPVFLLGESYGTMRAPVMANALLSGDPAIAPHGVGLLGQAVQVQETANRPGNLIGHIVSLPLMAAIGHYHGLVAGDSVDEVVERAIDFSTDRYALALLRGSLLTTAELEKTAHELAELTGLPATEWQRRGLRISKEEFRHEILRHQGLNVGRYDARYTSAAHDPVRGDLPLDPSSAALLPAFGAAMETYLAELGIDLPERRYRLLDHSATKAWDWELKGTGGGLVPTGKASPFDVFDYASALSTYLRTNPSARLYSGTGHYDTLTTVGMVEHLIRTNNLPAERLHVHRYPSGHMPYTDPASAAAFSSDLRAFVQAAL